VLDGAHNPAAARTLKKNVAEYFGSGAKIDFVFGSLADKDYARMAMIISHVADRVVVTSPSNARRLRPEALETEFLKYLPRNKVFTAENTSAAITKAMSVSADGNICTTGSLYTVAEAMKCLGIREI
jgi:dihydropteroate synthase